MARMTRSARLFADRSGINISGAIDKQCSNLFIRSFVDYKRFPSFSLLSIFRDAQNPAIGFSSRDYVSLMIECERANICLIALIENAALSFDSNSKIVPISPVAT